MFNLFMYGTEYDNIVGVKNANVRMTKREMKEIQEEFHRQKEIYERKNGVMMSEECKKALYR